MKITICDLCKKPMENDHGISFESDHGKYRIIMTKAVLSNGIRYKKIDACPSCILKKATYNLNKGRKNGGR